jgi:hypothetical protein
VMLRETRCVNRCWSPSVRVEICPWFVGRLVPKETNGINMEAWGRECESRSRLPLHQVISSWYAWGEKHASREQIEGEEARSGGREAKVLGRGSRLPRHASSDASEDASGAI